VAYIQGGFFYYLTQSGAAISMLLSWIKHDENETQLNYLNDIHAAKCQD
jgi:hypothetical protein